VKLIRIRKNYIKKLKIVCNNIYIYNKMYRTTKSNRFSETRKPSKSTKIPRTTKNSRLSKKNSKILNKIKLTQKRIKQSFTRKKNVKPEETENNVIKELNNFRDEIRSDKFMTSVEIIDDIKKRKKNKTYSKLIKGLMMTYMIGFTTHDGLFSETNNFEKLNALINFTKTIKNEIENIIKESKKTKFIILYPGESPVKISYLISIMNDKLINGKTVTSVSFPLSNAVGYNDHGGYNESADKNIVEYLKKFITDEEANYIVVDYSIRGDTVDLISKALKTINKMNELDLVNIYDPRYSDSKLIIYDLSNGDGSLIRCQYPFDIEIYLAKYLKEKKSIKDYIKDDMKININNIHFRCNLSNYLLTIYYLNKYEYKENYEKYLYYKEYLPYNSVDNKIDINKNTIVKITAYDVYTSKIVTKDYHISDTNELYIYYYDKFNKKKLHLRKIFKYELITNTLKRFTEPIKNKIKKKIEELKLIINETSVNFKIKGTPKPIVGKFGGMDNNYISINLNNVDMEHNDYNEDDDNYIDIYIPFIENINRI